MKANKFEINICDNSNCFNHECEHCYPWYIEANLVGYMCKNREDRKGCFYPTAEVVITK